MKKKVLKRVLPITLLSVSILAMAACEANKKSSTKVDNGLNNLTIKQDVLDYQSKNGPIASYWFPEDLLSWTPAKDKDLAFNTSHVTLAKRIDKEKMTLVNETQNKDTKVVALAMMNESTSGNLSRGNGEFDAYTLTYWQYIDTLVYWGGSSGEGIIVPPSADVIDVAHRNGVPVLGTVFFPQAEHGGKIEWLREALKKDANGDFPFAQKLVEVAKSYGFDGWFINQESQGTDENPLNAEDSKNMQEFLIKLREYNGKELQTMWYDSQTAEGKMDWQNTLNDKNQMFLVDKDNKPIADSMFLNFAWKDEENTHKELLKKAAEYAAKIKIDPKNLYAGVDVQADDTDTEVDWKLFESSKNTTFTSLGLYAASSTFSNSESFTDYEQSENLFWVNPYGDPRQSAPTDTAWPGISKYVTERSSITELPVRTDFNLGNGYNYFNNGKKISERDWNNRSLTDLMPTYRWIIENEGDNEMVATIDYANAYNGGNSINFLASFAKDKVSTVSLFKTDLTLTDKTEFSIVARSDNKVSVSAVLTLENGDKKVLKGDKTLADKWGTVTFDMTEVKGQTVSDIALRFVSDTDIDHNNINLGGLTIAEKADSKKVDVKDLKIDDQVFEEEGTIGGFRLSWADSKSDELKEYHVYQVNKDGSKSFVGASTENEFFVNALAREKGLDKTTFEVYAVNFAGANGKAARAEITWPDNSIPKPKFTADKTVVAPGEEITLINQSNPASEKFKWEFVSGDPKESTKKNPKVKFDKAGTYSIKLTATNAKGKSESVTLKDFITVTEKAGDLKDLALNKPVEVSAQVNDGEAGPMAVDGKADTKWCATGDDKHNITIDLGKISEISAVKIGHAESGGEGSDMNTSDYTIEVSEDGTKFTEVVDRRKNSAAESIDAFKQVKARYVRLTVKKATQAADTAARIYDIQVIGFE
ncbi:endo-beta-N-acetylglucosaminidase [Lactococcus hodotermopsidis]|uniref:Endo-beta-N-acetylglucosaminidase n=1 Tax=Pseudolactococcus hodotermopsidis TaxID=2709157 RepID=A0A6A0BBW9_9LACT|nr:discoidin domain-containing protein [Lactococcus hodotermopsidis]GFH42336.1 endo-beta-N-acetylglucosaminidase [Lactococcus hodotermopsidis]